MSTVRFSPRGMPERFGLGGYSLALRRCALLMASGLLSDNDRLLFAASKSARSLLDHRVEAQAEMPSRAQPIRLATCWNPITGIVGCCAFAASGYSAAPRSSVRNSRRFI
jgi:hypothetical protein